jgi:hypothetical protein
MRADNLWMGCKRSKRLAIALRTLDYLSSHVWPYCVIPFQRPETMAQETSVQAVLQALQVFSGQPDKTSIDAANRWLQDFQHTASSADIHGESLTDIITASLKHGGRVITC